VTEEDPRATLDELVESIRGHFRDRLLGLYLFGSLATGDFYAGRSDIDLIAVLDTNVVEGSDLDALREMHERFESEHPRWRDRVEVLYLSRAVLATFASAPTGTVARISPGEPMHHRQLDGDFGWLLDWHGALNGEALAGPEAAEIGPRITRAALRNGVIAQLREMRATARENTVAYVPAQQGYIAATVSRGLYWLAMGELTSKEHAIEWAAHRYPQYADYLRAAYAAYRADVRGPHERLIDFVEEAARAAAAPE
jgi:predicted nucleotidyltransferase